MSLDLVRAGGSLIFALPAAVLCTCGLLGIEPPADLIHPLLVLGGLAGALALNLASVLRLHAAWRDGRLIGIAAIQTRGKLPNLLVLGWASMLSAAIVGYVFVENFLGK